MGPVWFLLTSVLESLLLTLAPKYKYTTPTHTLLFMEYGRATIERKYKTRENSVDVEELVERPKVTITVGQQNGNVKKALNPAVENLKFENGQATLISREDLILAPDPELNYVGNNNLEVIRSTLPRSRSYETLRRDFKLADCLDFIKAGVEAIIEDQVTSRFEAEELKVEIQLLELTISLH
ncbi:hypothetical protein J6590_029102 [Homalodisca vitripennis]|nr:hypothetical protein J6590_029102 [Homalodisca vitripennis]